MSRYAKIIRWTLGAAALVIAVLLIFILIAPRLINIDSVREELVSTLSQKIGGEVNFQTIRLSILPRPHVAVIEGRLVVPDAFQASWKSLSVSARLLPLFTGKIEIGAVSVDHPEISITIAPKAADTGEVPQSISAVITEKLAPLVGVASAIGKEPAVYIKAGLLKLRLKNRFDLVFSHMDGRIDLPPDRIQISLNTRTDFCEEIEVSADIDLKSLNGRGKVGLTRIRPQQLPPNLFATGIPKFGESLINLGLDFETAGFNTLKVVIKGSAPQLTVLGGDNPVALGVKTFQASIQKDERQIAVSLPEAILEQPKLSLAGKFLHDQQTGRLEMALKAVEVDVPSVRQSALALAGETAVVKEIFDIVRGGRVPALSFNSHGSTLSELGKLENITLSAGLSHGNIMVPGIDLNVQDASARVKIQNRTLSAEGISARYADTAVINGSLGLGLWGEKAPFHLDIGLNADLSQVPSILKRVLDDKQVLAEIDRIDVVSGRAEGRLILGETLKNIAATVKISDFTLAARLAPIPTVVIVKGGDLLYSGTTVRAGRIEGKLKRSSFKAGPLRLDWRQTPLMDIQAGSAELHLDEIHASLLNFPSLQNTLKRVESINGTVSLSRLVLNGRLTSPMDWDFQAAGSARDVQVKSDLLPAPVSVRSAGFNATPDVLTITQAEIGTMDAALKVSARLMEYRRGLQTADMRFGGTVGARGNQWLRQKIKMPPNLTVRPPLQFSNGHVVWQRNGPTAFSGDLTIQNDLNVSTDVVIESGSVNIKKVVVRDRESTAAFTFKLGKGKEIDFGFKGNLQKATVDKLLADNRTLDGWIKGDLRLAYAMDRPMDTRFEGTLSAKDLIFLERLGFPIKAKSITITGVPGKFNITADVLFEQDKEIQLTGQVEHSSRGIRFDTSLTSGGIVVDDLVKVLGKGDKKEKGAPKDKFWEFPVEGVVKLDSAYVTYGKYTWQPLRGTVSLKPDKIDVVVSEAVLCGISTPGILTLTPREIRLKFEPAAQDQNLSSSGQCLLEKESRMEGRYTLTAQLTGQGSKEKLMRSLAGRAELNVGNGRFYSGRTYWMLKEILAILNVTEIYRGKLPDINKEGFGFNSITVKMKLEDNTIVIEEGFIDGLNMGIAVNGDLSLANDSINLTVLVAPLKTVDSIVKRIPLVRDILGGNLVSIPVSVKGNLKKPDVAILPPAAVGEGLLGIMKRTLELPVKVIQPVIPGKAK